MKISLVIMYILLSNLCSGQSKQADTLFIDLDIPYKPAVVILLKDTAEVMSQEWTWNGSISKNHLEAGHYKLFISGPGKAKELKKNFSAKPGQQLKILITMDGPCLYDYKHAPICPENHKDNIIPIVYGLVVLPANSPEREKIYLGGCVVTDCDPQYFCTIHKKKF